MAPSTNVAIDKFGPPGMPGDFVVLDMFRSETRSDRERQRDSTPREFEVTSLLSRSPPSTDDLNLSVETERGGSYVSAHPDAAKTLIKIPDGTLEVRHNSKREMASLHFKCSAASPAEARRLFLNAVSPFVDHISYLGNVPLHIALVECNDPKNHLRTYNYINPHPQITVNPHEATLYERLFPIYALYREAKNTQSPFYKFLCYYKVLEGIYNHLRPEIFTNAKRRGISLTREKETVPEHDELKATHPDLIGKPIKDVFDSRFTPTFRNEVAHYILSDGGVLNVSEALTAERFGAELLPIELCARAVIAVQERYESQAAQ